MKRISTLFLACWLFAEAFGKYIIALVLVGLFGMALAQDVDPVTAAANFDFASWGKNAALFGGFIAAAVSLIKGRIPALNGWRVLILAFVLAELGAFLLFSAGLLTDPNFVRFTPPYVWLMFGLAAWVVAAGGYAALIQLLTARKSVVAVPVPVTGPVELHPLGTPGTEPLHDLSGQVIGAVKPLTPSWSDVQATAARDERLP